MSDLNKFVFRSEIADSKYFMCGYGESYEGKVINGSDLLKVYIEAIWDSPENCQEDIGEAFERLNDPDHWWGHETKFDMWDEDIGETDHIEFRRVSSQVVRLEDAEEAVRDLRGENERLRASLNQARDEFKRLEFSSWSEPKLTYLCPSCSQPRKEHAENCQLNKLVTEIKALEGDGGGDV